MGIFSWLKSKFSYEARYVLLLFFVSRIVLAVIGVISLVYLKSAGGHFRWDYHSNSWLNVWGVWDSGWYLDIAKNGYSILLNSNNQANYGFFPFYPFLMKIVGLIVQNYFVAGLLVSNICFLLSCYYLFKLVRLDEDGRTALRSVKYLFLFPAAFIFSAVFSESLFLLLLLMCFYYARKNNWSAVGIAGFFMSLTRPQGILMFIPLAYEYLASKDFDFRRTKFDFIFLLLIPLGLLVFIGYTYHLTGDFFAYQHIKITGWKIGFTNPIKTLYLGLASTHIEIFLNTLYISFLIIFLILMCRKIRFSYILSGFLLLIPALSSGMGPLVSLFRYSITIFSLCIVVAKSASDDSFDQILCIILALIQGFLMVFWTAGFWLVV